MKTALVAMHQLTPAERIELYQCQGVLSLTAALLEAGLECYVPDLADLHNLMTCDAEFFLAALTDRILAPAPDVVGFSVMSSNLPLTLILCARIKQRAPHIFTLLGGQSPSFCAREILEGFPAVDAVLRGEAENTLPAFISQLMEKKTPQVKGLVIRGQGMIGDYGWPDPISNLDTLPVPAYHLCTPPRKTGDLFGDYNGVCLEIGRGCPFRCVYCSTTRFFKHKYRLKSLDRVLAEIHKIQECMGNQRILFIHDLFTLNPGYVRALCGQLQITFPGLVWKCHARFNTLSGRLLKDMKNAGCNEIFLGLESAAGRMQKLLNKNLSLVHVNKILKKLKALNFRFSLSYITGFPEEKLSETQASIGHSLQSKFRCRSNVVIKINRLQLFPGTSLYAAWEKHLVFDEALHALELPAFPRAWQELNDMIRHNPGICSSFYYVKGGTAEAGMILKTVLLGKTIEQILPVSLTYLYACLGKQVAALIFKHLEALALPSPEALHRKDYDLFVASLVCCLRQELVKRRINTGKWDALTALELTAARVSSHKSVSYAEVISLPHDPAWLLAGARGVTKTIAGKETENRFLIFWDEDKHATAYVPLSVECAAALEKK